MADALAILYEDNHCLAVAKPAPLLTQGVPQGIPTLEAQVKAYLKERYHKAGNVYLGIPHRLDRPVSGVVLFARNTKAARRLAEQFQQRQVTKLYWAALEGEVTPPEGVWEDWLLKIPEEARAEIATPETPGARQALLRYSRLNSGDGCTILEIRLETGRMHQIRVQAAARGWPIWGDLFTAHSTRSGRQPCCPATASSPCTRSLTFLHPIRYEPITVIAPLPDTWRDLPIVPLP